VKQAEETAPPSRDLPGVVEHLFSLRGGQDAGDLDPFFGLEHLTVAEEVVPENPSAWIMRPSRNLALDVVRRVSKWHYGGGRAYEAKLALGMEGESSDRNLLHLLR
jgi:hypothetical protein